MPEQPGGQFGQDNPFGDANPFGAAPVEPKTTKPRQMPGGGSGSAPPGSGLTDTNVPQPGAEQAQDGGQDASAQMTKATRLIRRTNPWLTDHEVQRLAIRVVAEFSKHPPAMKPPPGRRSWQPSTGPLAGGDNKAGDLNDPENPHSPLNPAHPNHEPHRTNWGNLNSSWNPLSPLHSDHPYNAQVMKGASDFAQQGADWIKNKFMGSQNPVVAFFQQYESDDEGEPTSPLVL